MRASRSLSSQSLTSWDCDDRMGDLVPQETFSSLSQLCEHHGADLLWQLEGDPVSVHWADTQEDRAYKLLLNSLVLNSNYRFIIFLGDRERPMFEIKLNIWFRQFTTYQSLCVKDGISRIRMQRVFCAVTDPISHINNDPSLTTHKKRTVVHRR